jgi:hypothetical protein
MAVILPLGTYNKIAVSFFLFTYLRIFEGGGESDQQFLFIALLKYE